MKKEQAENLLREVGLCAGYTCSQGTTIWKGNCYVITLPISRMDRKQFLAALEKYGVTR